MDVYMARIGSDDALREDAKAWMRAHGLDPGLIPEQAAVHIDAEAGTLTVETYQRHPSGKIVASRHDGGPTPRIVTVEVPLVAALPRSLYPLAAV